MRKLAQLIVIAAGLGLILFGCEKPTDPVDATAPSIPPSKVARLINPIYSAEPIQYDKSFDITQTLTPESEAIYQRALADVKNQLKSLKKQANGANTLEIYPTGVYPDDRINVQTLILQLGEAGLDAKVILKSKNAEGVPTTFNFGFSRGSASGDGGYAVGGWVVIHPFYGSGSIEFVGERNGAEITTISGGFRFSNFEGGSFIILDRIDDDFSFKDIRFTNEGGGIETARLGSFHVSACIFDNISTPMLHFGGGGSVIIEDNTFEDVGVPTFLYNHNPNAAIRNNRMNDVELGLAFYKLTGSYLVTDNIIRTVDGGWAFVRGFYLHGDGMDLLPFEGASVEISDNIISSDAPDAAGIYIQDNFNGSNFGNVLVKNNRVDLNSESSIAPAVTVIGLGNTIRDICISDNKISGTASAAIFISSGFGLPPSDISNISIYDNNLKDFETNCLALDGLLEGDALGCVDVYFGPTTHDLTFCGEAGIVIDRGVNNTLTEDNCPECQ